MHEQDDNPLNFIGKVNDDFEAYDVGAEHPKSLSHLLKILWKTDEKRQLSLSNPDGFFYLYYLKTLIKLFAVMLIFTAIPIMVYCYKSNIEDGKKKYKSIFRMISVTSSLNDPYVYYMALFNCFLISIFAFYFLTDFCSEMIQFEFQPD